MKGMSVRRGDVWIQVVQEGDSVGGKHVGGREDGFVVELDGTYGI